MRYFEYSTFSKNFHFNNNVNILEIGAGVGFYSDQIIIKKPSSYTCIDVSSKMLSQIKSKSIKKICVDFNDFKSSDRYDIILCLGVVEFFESPADSLQKIYELLASKGRAYFYFPKKNLLGRLYFWMHKKNGFEITLFHKKEYRKELERLSFRIEFEKRIGFFNSLVCVSKQ